jgi:hypothetical protein
MTPKRLADSIEGLIVTANEKYASRISRVQNQLYDAMVGKLKDLEIDSEGYIKQNANNRKILREAQNTFDTTISKSIYESALNDHLKVIPTINQLNNDYFDTISSAFKPNRVFIQQLQASTIETLNTYILQDELTAQIKLPLNEILNQNINSGGSYSGMVKQLETFIKGNNEVEGRLLRYTKVYVSDTLFNYSRAYQQAVTADLGLSWYLYSGGLMDKSRPFCTARAGKFFHESEVKDWASLEWQGKNQLTTESSIFVYAGGHNCRHQITPVSEIIVPQEDLDRLSK